MLHAVSPVYLWIGAAPSLGVIICSLIQVIRRVLEIPSDKLSKRAIVAAVMMSHLVAIVGAFYVGRASGSLKKDPHELVDDFGDRVPEQLERDRYIAQKTAALWMGHTRLSDRPWFITPEQIESIQPKLRPGDIILERRNWYASNAFLPGFWPHAAMYIGSAEDLKALDILDKPAIQKHLTEYLTAGPDGRPHTIIEAVGKGVSFNSITHSMHADYAAVLRPRLSQKEIAKAIVRAFENLGKPYDFDFSFDNTDKLVCSQLVYESYKGMLDFKVRRIAGRNTLPPVDIARKFVDERRLDDRQLDFVLFLDAVPSEGTSRQATEAEFCESISRSRMFVEK